MKQTSQTAMLAVLCLAPLLTWAQAPESALLDDFEEPNWTLGGSTNAMTFALLDDAKEGAKSGRFETTATSRKKLDAWWVNVDALQTIRARGAAFTGLSFWCKGDGSANMGAIQLSANGGQARFVALFPLRSRNWGRIELPWSDFEDLWDQTPAPGAKLTFTNVDFAAIGCRREMAPYAFQIDGLRLATFVPRAYPRAAGRADTLSLARLGGMLAQKRKITYVALGDSITVSARGGGGPQATYHARLAAALQERYGAEVEAVNAGVGGDIAMEGRVRVDEDVIARKPDLVTMFFGANDTYYELSKESYRHAMALIIRDIREQTDADIILITPVPWLKKEATMERFVAAVHELGAECHVPVAECFQVFRDLDGEISQYYGGDGVHLNVPGHRLVAETLIKAINDRCEPMK